MEPRCRRFVAAVNNFFKLGLSKFSNTGLMSDRRSRTIDQQVMEEQVERKCLHGNANSQVGEEKTNHRQNPSSLAEAGRTNNMSGVGEGGAAGRNKGLG